MNFNPMPVKKTKFGAWTVVNTKLAGISEVRYRKSLSKYILALYGSKSKPGIVFWKLPMAIKSILA